MRETNRTNPDISLASLSIETSELNREKEIEDKKEKGESGQNLVFGIKKISPFRLYYHISGKFEIFLMIVATIFTIGAGVSDPVLQYLLGDMLDDFLDTNEIEELPDDQYKIVLDQVKPVINKIIKKTLIIGSIMSVCHFFMIFLWSYASLRQML